MSGIFHNLIVKVPLCIHRHDKKRERSTALLVYPETIIDGEVSKYSNCVVGNIIFKIFGSGSRIELHLRNSNYESLVLRSCFYYGVVMMR